MPTYLYGAIAALVLAAGAISPAVAFLEGRRFEPHTPSRDGYTSDLDRPYVQPGDPGCPMSSAKEGNAEQQNFPVKQYGQTSGGYRC